MEREKELGRNDLILPIYYIESKLDDKQIISIDELAGIITYSSIYRLAKIETQAIQKYRG